MIEIKPLNVVDAAEQDYSALNIFNNRLRKERRPDDLPISVDEMKISYQNIPNFIHYSLWAAWEEESAQIVGRGNIVFSMDDNLHMAQFMIQVLPEYRRQGLAKKFLSLIAEEAKNNGRRLLITNTEERVHAGEKFVTKLGASKGIEAHTNQLALKDVQPQLIKAWKVRGEECKDEFELGYWFGKYPQEYIDAIVELHDLLNQQPFDDLEYEPAEFTAEKIREEEQALFARGMDRWTLYVRERSSGKFAGYTEVFWSPNRPEIIQQGITGVFPAFRNKGLGRWLKAVMLEKVLADRSEAKFIRTENADSNVPMMKINKEMGFKPYSAEIIWQMPLENVETYLKKPQD